MIPLVAKVHVRTRDFRVRLWLPLFLMWLLLLPVVIVLLPAICVVCAIARVNPLPFARPGWMLLAGLSGTNIEVNHGDECVLVRIR